MQHLSLIFCLFPLFLLCFFIFAVFWTLTKRSQFKLSFSNTINIAYFWARHSYSTGFLPCLLCLIQYRSVTAQLLFAEFLLNCRRTPRTIFSELQSLLYQRIKNKLFLLPEYRMRNNFAAPCLSFLSIFFTTLYLIIKTPQLRWFIFISMLIIRCSACFFFFFVHFF